MARGGEVPGERAPGILTARQLCLPRDPSSVRTAREVLNELRWREGRDLAKAEIWVRGRSPEDVKAMGGDEITELGRRYFSTATTTIPYYKIARIVSQGKVLFERPG